MANKLQIKRGVKSTLPTLSAGELGYCTDTHDVYVGTGSANKLIGGPNPTFESVNIYQKQITGISPFASGLKSSITYRKIFTLPVSSGSNSAQAVLTGQVGGWMDTQGKAYITVNISNRGSEQIQGVVVGNLYTNDILVYREADGSLSVHAKIGATYALPWTLTLTGTLTQNVAGVTYVMDSTSETTTTPTGTLIWSLSTSASVVIAANGLNSGNVGIGTTAPSMPLHLLGTTRFPATSGTSQEGAFRIGYFGGMRFRYGFYSWYRGLVAINE